MSPFRIKDHEFPFKVIYNRVKGDHRPTNGTFQNTDVKLGETFTPLSINSPTDYDE